MIFIDQNGDGIINDRDKVNIGDPNPDLTYGFNINLDYKGLDFTLLANGVAGNQLCNLTETRRASLPTTQLQFLKGGQDRDQQTLYRG